MSKAYIELKYKHRKYKLNADDIAKVYKIVKRKCPSLPQCQDSFKNLPETDDDTEVISTVSL
jgi:hypothetical protein